MLVVTIFLLAIISGALGIGVALVAVPVLSLALPDLVNQVHPVSLLLNGVTALFAAIAFGRAGLIDIGLGLRLLAVATFATPLGAMVARMIPEFIIWVLYFASVIFLLGRLLVPIAVRPDHPSAAEFSPVLWLAFPASFLSGLIGVGPGFLLVPIMLHYGIDIRKASGLNALAVTPASFLATLPHLGHMLLPAGFLLPLLVAGSLGGIIGAWLASYRLSSGMLKWIFFFIVAGTAAYRALTLIVDR